MARRPSTDPLIPVPVRLPASLAAHLRALADAGGCTVSDALRAHLSLDAAKPLGKPRPRRREPKRLGAVSGADPALMRALASIGNNLNQIARATNGAALAGTPIDVVRILASLKAIEQEIMLMGECHAH